MLENLDPYGEFDLKKVLGSYILYNMFRIDLSRRVFHMYLTKINLIFEGFVLTSSYSELSLTRI